MHLLLALLATLATLPRLDLAPAGPTLRFAVAGDTGSGAEAVSKGIARVHAEAPLDAILLTGDNFYPCGVATPDDPRWSLAAPLSRVGIPVFPVLGNHDYCGKADPDAQIGAPLDHWRFPARQYALRTPLADFAFVDTTPLVKGWKSELVPALRQAFDGSKAPWRIVVGHHPVISSGYHGYFPRDEVARMRTAIPALREVKADFYICGHDHHMEVVRGRMLHLVSGAGSNPVLPLMLRLRTVYPESIEREGIGFAVVEITKRLILIRVYDASGEPRSDWILGGTSGRATSGRVRSQPAPK